MLDFFSPRNKPDIYKLSVNMTASIVSGGREQEQPLYKPHAPYEPLPLSTRVFAQGN